MSGGLRTYSPDELVALSGAPRGNVLQTPEHYWRRAGLALQLTCAASVVTAAVWPRALPLPVTCSALAFFLFCVGTARRDFVAARYVDQLSANEQEAQPAEARARGGH